MGIALQHTVSEIISQLLIDQGLGTLPADGSAWPTFYSWHPAEPSNLVCAYDTSPDIQGRLQIDGEVQEHYGFMIRVRGESHSVGYLKAQDIDRYLMTSVKRTVVSIGGQSYIVHAVTRRSGILSIGREKPENQLDLFTINYTVSLGLA